MSEIRGCVALALAVVSPAPDAAIASKCDGVASDPTLDAGAWTEIRGRVALAGAVQAPASHKTISVRALLHTNNPRRKKRSNQPRPRQEWTSPPGVFRSVHIPQRYYG